MDKLPYNQITSFTSSNFTQPIYKIINIINLPVFILKNIIEYLDLKSIYKFSRTCWKMLLLSRTNMVANYVLELSSDTDTIKKFKKKFDKNVKHYTEFNNSCCSLSRNFYKLFNDKIKKNINSVLKMFDGNIQYKNSYGFQIYKEYGHFLEIILFGFKYIIFMYASEYLINKNFNNLLWKLNGCNYNTQLMEAVLEHEMCELMKSVCDNNCYMYDCYYNDLSDEWDDDSYSDY